MPEPRDELDTWLGVQVRPLLPPPGTFERISRQARRRRARRALLAAAGAVAIAVVAAMVIPQVALPALESGRHASAAGSPSPPVSPPRPASVASSPAASSPAASSPAPVSTPAPVTTPPRLSATFVGVSTGWVMGQAIPAGRCDLAAAPACIVLRRTDTAGAAWRTVIPPPTHGPDGTTGVSQVRFLTRSDGWAFGPQLWATHNAGRTWTQIQTGGWRVTALEARGQRVFAVWARCTGTGPRFASHCTDFTVHSSAAGSNTWAPAPGASAGSSLASTGSGASLMLTGTAAYLLLPDGTLLSGPLTGAAWQQAAGTAGQAAGTAGQAAPCRPGPAQPDGQPSGALLASTSAGLALVCTGPTAGGQQSKAVYTSGNGGQAWQRTGQAPVAGTATFLSGSPSGALVLATSMGIEVSADGGATWSAAGGTMPPGGFAYVGMTTAAQGVAVPAGPARSAVWLTYDGGSTWAPSSASA